ncbi:unnamed protein product [Rotaria magnacalcarata]|uniref:SOCS box domain-containing protein n=1 Tax=Rotaria magnacalcarata TaxID=392030 RepID=A0A816VFX1_9BILA|nr:unnamed protein product [Rotaria magnacalcarata]CAF2123818.1 unnamed protein product [Rotaria magnacalcarata]CAF3871859.1 unnamed protein product [Rotaria magnacalcarata]CAF4163588.1 unnamed protein product [Rotaria magnacalcarata]
MHSFSINQLVNNGLITLDNISENVVCHMLDMKVSEDSAINNTSKLSVHKFKFSQQYSSREHMAQQILDHSSFINTNMAMLLRSALMSGAASFRYALHDFKMIHKRIFAEEINKFDKQQNTLLWYLTIAGLYTSIEDLYRLSQVELNINIKNGSFNQTILHYAVMNGNIEDIRIILEIGIDTNLGDQSSRTALHYIALYGTKNKNDVDIAKLLIDHGALPNLQDSNHQTSLHCAIRKENYDLVAYLISLPTVNVCIKDKEGYGPLGYLCEHILNLSDISLEYNQCTDSLEQIFKIIYHIIDRCPFDQLSYNFHITKNDKMSENLLLRVYNKFTNLRIPMNTNALFHRLHSIVIGTEQDHRLLVERLLELHSWQSAIIALSNTHNVNILNALIECIAHDSHVLLIQNISPSSYSSVFFALIFYVLATNMTLLRNIVPMCKLTISNDDELCHTYIDNYSLHTNYVTFIHTFLHYASCNVFSLKHLCRYHIRHHLKSHIIDKIDKCSYLKLKYRDYIKFNELLLIYSKIDNLSYIVYLIKRLYKIDQINEDKLFQNEIKDNLESSSYDLNKSVDISTYSLYSTETSLNSHTDQTLSSRSNTIENDYESSIETFEPIHQRTIEEIMVESNFSIQNSHDNQTESEHSLQPTMKTSMTEINVRSMTKHKSTLSFSDDENLAVQFQNELADMKAKSNDIEEMIAKFLLKS